MQCDVCNQKKASVFLTQIIKGEMQKINLCEDCSREKGVTDPTGFALADMLLGFGQGERIESQPQERVCPACGMTQSSFRKTGRLGCSKCYGIFSDGMDALLRAMHKGTRHTGKIPSQAGQLRDAEEHLAELRTSLEAAVNGENFEDAARLRDEIHAAESVLSARKSAPQTPLS